MNILTRMARRFGFAKPAAVKPGKRSYSAAKVDRLTYDWITSDLSMDSELRRSLKKMRARSRELERNDDYVRNFLNQAATNVVGPSGFKLQMQIKNADGTPDKFANDVIEKAFMKWCKKGMCTMDGRLSWSDAQRLYLRSVARDGETLTRQVRGKSAGNDYGFAIQIVEPDHLDEEDFRTLANGNRVKMGVEVNGWNRPQAYYLSESHPGDTHVYYQRNQVVRVPANDCLHGFVPDRPGQTRGIPWLVSAMTRLHMLGGYEQAELIASRVAASKMGFFEDSDDTTAPLAAADSLADEVQSDGTLLMDAEPGTFHNLPTGKKFTSWDPQHPNGAFGGFIKAMLRGVGASVSMFYPSISGDLEGVNFSSIRHGVLMEREVWRVLQDWMVQSFLQPVFENWLEMALTTGAVPLPLAKFDKFNAPLFQPRGWQWVDPLKDVNASIASLGAGLTTRTQILAQQGRSFEDVLDELVREQQQLEQAGLSSGFSFAPDSGDMNNG